MTDPGQSTFTIHIIPRPLEILMINKTNVSIIGFALGFLLLSSVSCQTPSSSWRGKETNEDLRVPLKRNGEGDGKWETRDVLLSYQYREADGRLELSGEVRIANHLRNSFAAMEYFHLRLFFLDAEGRVAGSKNFALGPSRKDVWDLPFKRSADTPDEAVAIAFGYSGRATSFNRWDFRSFSASPFK